MTTNKYQEVFEAQLHNQFVVANTPISERKKKLKRLLEAIEVTFRQEIRDALFADFGKHPAEVDLSEVFPVTSELKHAISRINKWTSPQSVGTPLAFMGSSSWIQYEPKGVCLIISPWNFPINLTFGPLVSAIAAGNTVIIKPSEHTPHASALIKKIVESLFKTNEIAVLEGAIETSNELLKLPFHHIFFTGAPTIGKIVMEAAAKNLTSVTLELGGKSPTIVDETANIDVAAKRTVWGKYINNGQVCIAPDYVFVHQSRKNEFIIALQKQIQSFFGEEPNKSDNLTKIVNKHHLNRLKSYLDQAVSVGAKVVTGGKLNEANNSFEPTVLENVPMDSDMMKNEIFGPFLPIYTFNDIKEPLDFINKNEKPLALYIYSKNGKNTKHILKNTSAGTTCINNSDLQFFNNYLPFGGVNNSGLGKSHGKFGFEAFSNARGVYKQHIPGALELLMPPYNNFKKTMIELTVKWF
jgi:aldehyde dehydrogenase (NAD+)